MLRKLLQEQINKAHHLPEDLKWEYVNQIPSNHFVFNILHDIIFENLSISEIENNSLILLYKYMFEFKSTFELL